MHNVLPARRRECFWLGPMALTALLIACGGNSDDKSEPSAQSSSTAYPTPSSPSTGASSPTSTATAWQSPSTRLSEGIFGQMQPQIAVDEQGRAIAAWMQNDATTLKPRLMVSHATEGTWTSARTLAADTSTTAPGTPGEGIDDNSHQLSMAPNGNATLVWLQDGKVSMKRYDDGQWDDTVYHPVIDTGGINITTDPPVNLPAGLRLNTGAEGRVTVVWTQYGLVWAWEFASSLWLPAATPIAPLASDMPVNPQPIHATNGDVLVAWQQGAQVLGNRRTRAAETWDIAQAQVVVPDSTSQFALTAAPGDQALIVWIPENGLGVKALHVQPTAGWQPIGTPALLSATQTAPASTASFLGVATDTQGAATVVWNQLGPDTIMAQRHTPGQGWQAQPQRLNTGGVSNGGNPKVSMSPNGHAAVAWTGSEANGASGVVVRRHEPGSGWLDATVIHDSAGEFPAIAVDTQGRMGALWTRVGTDGSVHASLFR